MASSTNPSCAARRSTVTSCNVVAAANAAAAAAAVAAARLEAWRALASASLAFAAWRRAVMAAAWSARMLRIMFCGARWGGSEGLGEEAD